MLIATEKRGGAGRRAGKLYYETPMSSTAASARLNCINSKRASGRATSHARTCIATNCPKLGQSPAGHP
jgi:hypothetical protein